MNKRKINRKIAREFKKLERTVSDVEKKEIQRLVRRYKNDYDALDKHLRGLFTKYEDEGKINYAQLVYDGADVELDYKVALNTTSRYLLIKKLTESALKNIAKSTKEAFSNIDEIPPIHKDLNVSKYVNRDMAGLNWVQRSGKNRDKAIQDLQVNLKSGLEKGKTYTQLSKELATNLSTDLYRADRIIRTEGHRLLNDVKLEGFQRINEEIPVKKKWLSAGDERVREGHAELDGVTIGVNEEFVSPLGGVGQSPGNMNNAADDINCRCIMIMEL